MPGFLGKIGLKKDEKLFNKNNNSSLINNKLTIGDFYIEQRTLNKFLNDKVFEYNTKYFVLTEGIILNSIDLKRKYNGNTLYETIIHMYQKNGDDFFKEFRGTFSGVFFDKEKDKKIIYTSHTGEKEVFYYLLDDSIVFGSEINYILEYLKNNNIRYYLSRESAYYLLTYGYMLEDYSLISGVKKLTAGHYILFENGKFKLVQYHRFNNIDKIDQSEDEIINTIDFLFRTAIQKNFEKDKEYGFKHLVALSGGLDSRMTTWVAHDMGYGDNIVNYTFSQSDFLDETTPKKIARDLKHEWIFKFLDNGVFLKNIDDVTRISGGEVLYYTLSHTKSLFDLLDLGKFGVNHTGQVGGIIKGYYNKNEPLKMGGANSTKLLDRLSYGNLKSYKNEAEFILYNRQFNGTLKGNLVSQEKMESLSPFLYVDLMEYALSIPDRFNKNEIFIKWMLTKYPQAANYVWDEINGKVTDKQINILGHRTTYKQLPKKTIRYIMKKLNFEISNLKSKNHMNPLDYWYNTNSDLKNFMDSYYNTNIDRLDFDQQLKSDCIFLYEKGNCIEKNQVLSLLSHLKLYYGE
jgi:asparagine synthase (glutamine-hydrolysing)